MKRLCIKQFSFKKSILFFGFLCFFTILLYLVLGKTFFSNQSKKSVASGNNSVNKVNDEVINSDIIMSNEVKEKNKAQMQDSIRSNNKISINPVITNITTEGNTLLIQGYVDGIVENGGSCTYIVLSKDTKITRTTKSQSDANTVICDPVRILLSEIAPGTSEVMLKYISMRAEGSSDLKKVNIE
jgi:hypothetical protein